MIILGRVAAFLAVLAALVWLVLPVGEYEFVLRWDRLTVFLTALAAFCGAEVTGSRLYHTGGTRAHPNDVQLLQRLWRELEPDRVVPFLREHDFGGTFLRANTNPVLRFADTWVGGDKKFQERRIESAHQRLVSAAHSLSRLIALKTAPVTGDMQSAVPERFRGEQLPDWVRRDAVALNEAADNFVSAFDEFVAVVAEQMPLPTNN